VQLARQSRGGSAFMHALRRGAQVTITQPLQNFPLTFGRPGYVLAAGGIGITALVAMGRALKARGADYRFVYGARSRNLMAFLDELGAEHGDRLEVYVDDEDNRLDVGTLVKGCAPGTEMYVCGPIPMLDAIRRAWPRPAGPRSGCGSRRSAAAAGSPPNPSGCASRVSAWRPPCRMTSACWRPSNTRART
jgi:ferredoxin-NADP reductase